MRTIFRAVVAVLVVGFASFATPSSAAGARQAPVSGYESVGQRQVPVHQGHWISAWGHDFSID